MTLPALVQGLVPVLAAPLVNGVVRKVKARLQGRRGASVWQPYYDLAKLFAKDAVVSEDASWLFRAAPGLVFAALLTATWLLPVLMPSAAIAFGADLLLFVYLLAAARFFTLLAALDTGSAFTGMASSREAMLAALAEPAVLLALFITGLSAHSFRLGPMAAYALAHGGALDAPMRLLALVALLVMVVVETGRVPVDNPATHLELTMIHEGLLLEHSGRHLALMTWGAALKQALLLTLVIDLFLPWGMATSAAPGAIAIASAAYLAKLLGFGVVIGGLESAMAKMRLFQVPDLIGASFALSVLALISAALLG
ncbi:MAG TPA: NADH-quinone oxidoreductase subunit H [Oscillatoriaceae cyanobacterium]